MAAEPLTREQILAAAEEALRRYGPAKMNVVDVAAALGVSHGSVYRHFPTKAALHGELMAAKFRHHAEVARRWAREPDGWTAFEGLLRESFSAMDTDAALRQRLMWPEDGEALAAAETERLILSEVVGGVIARAQAEGRLRPDFGVQDMPAFMCAAGSVIAAGQVSPVVMVDRYLDLMVDALRLP